MYNNVALAVIPSGVKADTVYSLIGGDMTFARSSSATRRNKDGLIEYVDTDIPRLDYEGAIPHLLLEPSRTNGQVYSEDFSNAAWTKLNATITTNAEIAPDGNTTADAFLETTTSGEHRVYDAYTFASGNTYTVSVFVKNNGRDVFNIACSNQTVLACAANFDLTDQSVTNISGTGKIEDYGNGWYRCSVTGSSSSSGTEQIYYRGRKDGNISYAGDTNKGFYIWGAQIEEGSYATSYIPNLATGSTTRNAERCNSGSGNFNSNEGVLFVEVARIEQGGNDTTMSINAGSTNRVDFLFNGPNNNRIYCRVYSGGAQQVSFNTDLDNAFEFNKIAIKYKVGDFAVWINGVEAASTASTGVAPVGLNEFDFDPGTTSSYFYGKVRQAVVFNSALTDSQLAELTR